MRALRVHHFKSTCRDFLITSNNERNDQDGHLNEEIKLKYIINKALTLLGNVTNTELKVKTGITKILINDSSYYT